MERYKVIHEKDKKEIHKLRGLLGFLPKQDQATQVNFDDDCNLKLSKSTKLSSTETNIFRESKESWFSPEKLSERETIILEKVEESRLSNQNKQMEEA